MADLAAIEAQINSLMEAVDNQVQLGEELSTTVSQELDQVLATLLGVQAEVDLKLYTTNFNTTVTRIDGDIATKADKTYVDAQLATKVNQADYLSFVTVTNDTLTNLQSLKADLTYVDTELAKKAVHDTVWAEFDLVDAALADLDSTKSETTHLHDDRYLQLTGGTMTGQVVLRNNISGGTLSDSASSLRIGTGGDSMFFGQHSIVFTKKAEYNQMGMVFPRSTNNGQISETWSKWSSIRVYDDSPRFAKDITQPSAVMLHEGVEGELYYSKTNLDTFLATKHSQADFDTFYSSYVAAMALKASITYVDSQDAALQANIDLKADQTYTDTQLGTKVAQTAYDAKMSEIDAAIAIMVDDTEMATHIADVSAVLATKANIEYVNSQDALKVDQTAHDADLAALKYGGLPIINEATSGSVTIYPIVDTTLNIGAIGDDFMAFDTTRWVETSPDTQGIFSHDAVNGRLCFTASGASDASYQLNTEDTFWVEGNYDIYLDWGVPILEGTGKSNAIEFGVKSKDDAFDALILRYKSSNYDGDWYTLDGQVGYYAADLTAGRYRFKRSGSIFTIYRWTGSWSTVWTGTDNAGGRHYFTIGASYKAGNPIDAWAEELVVLEADAIGGTWVDTNLESLQTTVITPERDIDKYLMAGIWPYEGSLDPTGPIDHRASVHVFHDGTTDALTQLLIDTESTSMNVSGTWVDTVDMRLRTKIDADNFTPWEIITTESRLTAAVDTAINTAMTNFQSDGVFDSYIRFSEERAEIGHGGNLSVGWTFHYIAGAKWDGGTYRTTYNGWPVGIEMNYDYGQVGFVAGRTTDPAVKNAAGGVSITTSLLVGDQSGSVGGVWLHPLGDFNYWTPRNDQLVTPAVAKEVAAATVWDEGFNIQSVLSPDLVLYSFDGTIGDITEEVYRTSPQSFYSPTGLVGQAPADEIEPTYLNGRPGVYVGGLRQQLVSHSSNLLDPSWSCHNVSDGSLTVTDESNGWFRINHNRDGSTSTWSCGEFPLSSAVGKNVSVQIKLSRDIGDPNSNQVDYAGPGDGQNVIGISFEWDNTAMDNVGPRFEEIFIRWDGSIDPSARSEWMADIEEFREYRLITLSGPLPIDVGNATAYTAMRVAITPGRKDATGEGFDHIRVNDLQFELGDNPSPYVERDVDPASNAPCIIYEEGAEVNVDEGTVVIDLGINKSHSMSDGDDVWRPVCFLGQDRDNALSIEVSSNNKVRFASYIEGAQKIHSDVDLSSLTDKDLVRIACSYTKGLIPNLAACGLKSTYLSMAGSASIDGTLVESDNPLRSGRYYADFVLSAVTVGEMVTVDYTSPDFDCYMHLIDADTMEEITFNDDEPGGSYNSQLTFEVIAGENYIIRCTTYDGGNGGNFHLQTSSGLLRDASISGGAGEIYAPISAFGEMKISLGNNHVDPAGMNASDAFLDGVVYSMDYYKKAFNLETIIRLSRRDENDTKYIQ